MTSREKEGSQKPPESKAEDGPLTSSNLHMQQAVAYYAWAQNQAQTAARIAANLAMFGGSRAALLEYQVPASETKEGIERERAYYEALGRFVQIFAEVEKLIWQTLVHYVGTSHEVAKIVLTAGKVDQCATYIKQVAAANNSPKEKRDDLEFVLQQLGIINSRRDAILHYGATAIAEGRGTVSDAWKTKAEPKVFPISDIALTEMTDDARKIIAHLTERHLGRPQPPGGPDISSLEQVLRRAWRYKYHLQPKTRTKKVEAQPQRKRRPKLPRQPQS
jgi:hypothetical protein